MSSNIVITNKKIVDYFNTNKHIDIESIILQFIDLLESVNASNLNNPSVLKDLIKQLNDNKQEMISRFDNTTKLQQDSYQSTNKDLSNILNSLTLITETSKNEFGTLKTLNGYANETIKKEMDTIKLLLTNMSNSLTSKIYETKDNYVSEIKQLLKSSDSENNIMIRTLIDKYNEETFQKIKDILPTSLNNLSENIFNNFKKELNICFDKLFDNKISLDNISILIDNKYNNLLSNINNNLLNIVNATEDKMCSNVNNLRETIIKNVINQENVNTELIQYLNKYNKASSKGELSEIRLYNLLSELYPSAELKDTSKETGMGDIIMKRVDKPVILLENKNYNSAIKKDEIEKFLRDITNNKCNGIFISQNNGIVGKENFQIDIHNNNILVYIHNCNYDKSKIDLGVKIIDILSQKLTYMEDGDIKLSKELLEKINYEYNSFLTKKEELGNTIKEFYKKSMDQHKDLVLPSLELYLSEYFATSKKNILTCDICKVYQETNLMSLSRHKSACLKRLNKKEEEKKDDKKVPKKKES